MIVVNHVVLSHNGQKSALSFNTMMNALTEATDLLNSDNETSPSTTANPSLTNNLHSMTSFPRTILSAVSPLSRNGLLSLGADTDHISDSRNVGKFMNVAQDLATSSLTDSMTRTRTLKPRSGRLSEKNAEVDHNSHLPAHSAVTPTMCKIYFRPITMLGNIWKPFTPIR